jgi:hypothetical protein
MRFAVLKGDFASPPDEDEPLRHRASNAFVLCLLRLFVAIPTAEFGMMCRSDAGGAAFPVKNFTNTEARHVANFHSFWGLASLETRRIIKVDEPAPTEIRL